MISIDSDFNGKPCSTNRKLFPLIDDIQPVYYVGKFIGLAPFSLQYQHHQNIFNWKLLIIDIVIILLHIVIQFIFFFMTFQLMVMPSSSLLIVDFGIVVTMTCFSIFRTIMSCGFLFIRNKIHLDIIKELIKIDEEVFVMHMVYAYIFFNSFLYISQMKKLGIEINHNYHRKFVLFYTIFLLSWSGVCVLSTTTIIIYFEIIYYTFAERVLMVLLVFYTSCTFAMVKSYYFLALLAVRTRISAINKYLRYTFSLNFLFILLVYK